MKWLLIIVCFIPFTISAKDFGHQGHVFPIQEKNLLEAIQERLQYYQTTGKLTGLASQMQAKARKNAMHPKPLIHIQDAVETKTFFFDPTITVPFDLKDHQGRIFHHKGETLNPLEFVSMVEILFFVNGDNEDQIEWLKPQLNKTSMIILTRGNPEAMHEELNHTIYFDQMGAITKRLNITAVPARVTQEGKQLKIEQIAVKEESI